MVESLNRLNKALKGGISEKYHKFLKLVTSYINLNKVELEKNISYGES